MNKLIFLILIIPSLHAMVRSFAPQVGDDQATLNRKLSQAVKFPENIHDVEQLLAQGADVNAKTDTYPFFILSSFEHAICLHAQRPNPQIFDYYYKLFLLLLAAGADLYNSSVIVLVGVARFGNFELVRLFLRYGKNTDELLDSCTDFPAETVAKRMLRFVQDRYYDYLQYGLIDPANECIKIMQLIDDENRKRDFLIEDDDNPRSRKWRKTDANIAQALMNRELGIK